MRERLRGLDSGWVWGGKLTAWIADEDRIVQVDAARTEATVYGSLSWRLIRSGRGANAKCVWSRVDEEPLQSSR